MREDFCLPHVTTFCNCRSKTVDQRVIIIRSIIHGSSWSGPWFNSKMSSYQYRKSHCGDKTVVRSSYLHNGFSYTDKMTSLYWFSPLRVIIIWSIIHGSSWSGLIKTGRWGKLQGGLDHSVHATNFWLAWITNPFVMITEKWPDSSCYNHDACVL